MTRLRDLTDPDHLPALDRNIAITRPGAGRCAPCGRIDALGGHEVPNTP